MNKYYYTFGTDPVYPLCGGYVIVFAGDWSEAHRKFRAKYQDVPGKVGVINCAFFYDERAWKKNKVNMGICHKVIK